MKAADAETDGKHPALPYPPTYTGTKRAPTLCDTLYLSSTLPHADCASRGTVSTTQDGISLQKSSSRERETSQNSINSMQTTTSLVFFFSSLIYIGATNSSQHYPKSTAANLCWYYFCIIRYFKKSNLTDFITKKKRRKEKEQGASLYISRQESHTADTAKSTETRDLCFPTLSTNVLPPLKQLSKPWTQTMNMLASSALHGVVCLVKDVDFSWCYLQTTPFNPC